MAAAMAGANTPDGKRRHKDAEDDSNAQKQPKTVTPEELTKMMKEVERLVKDQEKTEEIQDAHTRVLRRLMIEKRREDEIETSRSYEVSGLPTEEQWSDKLRFLFGMVEATGIPKHEIQEINIRSTQRLIFLIRP